MVGLPQGDSPALLNTSYTVTADIDVPQDGAEGIVLDLGQAACAGYGFYLLKGKPVWLWNLIDLERIKWESLDALTPGKHIVEFDFKYDGMGPGTLAFNNFSGVGRPGTGTLKVDGKVVDTKRMPKTLPMILQWDETRHRFRHADRGERCRLQAAVPTDGQAQHADDKDRPPPVAARRNQEARGRDAGCCGRTSLRRS